jgi:acyl-CoA thioesterase FadM
MGEYLRAISFSYPEAFLRYGADTFAVRAEASFVGSAVYDDTLELAVRAEQLGRTSFRLLIGIFRGEALLTQIRMTYVYVSTETRKPQRLSDELVSKIVGYERIAPAAKA